MFHNDLECEVIHEEMIGLGLCLNSLPLFYTPASDHSSQRFVRIMNKDATKLLLDISTLKESLNVFAMKSLWMDERAQSFLSRLILVHSGFLLAEAPGIAVK